MSMIWSSDLTNGPSGQLESGNGKRKESWFDFEVAGTSNKPTIGCKTRDTLCKILESSWWTLHYSWKIYRLLNFAPPPNQCWSLFPALWSFRVWSTLCRGKGGMFYLRLGYSKIRQKRSSVSSVLQPIVVCKHWVSTVFQNFLLESSCCLSINVRLSTKDNNSSIHTIFSHTNIIGNTIPIYGTIYQPTLFPESHRNFRNAFNWAKLTLCPHTPTDWTVFFYFDMKI